MRIGTEAKNITGLRLDSWAYMYKHANYDRISDHSHMLLCARGWDCKQLQSDFFFFIFRGHIGQELFEMFKIDHDSTWASDMDVGWEYFSCDFGIWLSEFRRAQSWQWAKSQIAALISAYADAFRCLNHGPYYKWTNNASLSLISSWPPPPDNVHLDEHIHASWQCWLRNHESSQTKGPFTSLRIHFAEVPFHDTYLDWMPVDEEQRTQNYENLCDTRLIITEADTGGHASDLA